MEHLDGCEILSHLFDRWWSSEPGVIACWEAGNQSVQTPTGASASIITLDLRYTIPYCVEFFVSTLLDSSHVDKTNTMCYWAVGAEYVSKGDDML